MARDATARDDDGGSSALYAVAGALLVVGLLIAFAWFPRLLSSHDPAAIGRDAPDLHLKIIANPGSLATPPAPPPAEVLLSSLKGKAVLLDYWATWCGPCRAEMPIVDRVAARYRDKGLVTIGVNAGEDPDDVAPWIKRNGVSYPIASDDGSAQRAFAVENLPTLVIISTTGKIVAVRVGMTDASELERLVNEAL